MTTYRGKSVVSGIAFGCVHVLKSEEGKPEHTKAVTPGEQWECFQKAKEEADAQLELLFEKTKEELGEEHAMIIDVQRLMLEDDDFLDAVKTGIFDEKLSALAAISNAGKQFSEYFASLDDEYMQARATDVLDISGRISDILLGKTRNFELEKMSVIVADDLTPSETLQLDREKIAAFVICKGGVTSHTAILAHTMNIPCLIQTDIVIDDRLNGKEAIVDGIDGVCYIDPDDKITGALKEKYNELMVSNAQLDEVKNLRSVTKSGKEILVCANIGSPGDVKSVLENGADGIGLFRSEFLYLGRNDFPTEDELFEVYRSVVAAMDKKPVIIRTLDIGADKKVDYFGLEMEENPALGLRGIRICIERPEIFKTQLRAIYRASAFGNVLIMFPMIASKWEVQFCIDKCESVKTELKNEKLDFGDVRLGVMIETPAAAMISDELAKLLSFFSVGTNDLTQYTLAIDRQNNKLERFYDSYHPAVLELMRLVAENAAKNGIWAGICGEMGADTALADEFIKMGYTELSVSPYRISEVRKKVRDLV